MRDSINSLTNRELHDRWLSDKSLRTVESISAIQEMARRANMFQYLMNNWNCPYKRQERRHDAVISVYAMFCASHLTREMANERW